MKEVENIMVQDAYWPKEAVNPWEGADDESITNYLMETDQMGDVMTEAMEDIDMNELFMQLPKWMRRKIIHDHQRRHDLEMGYTDWWMNKYGR